MSFTISGSLASICHPYQPFYGSHRLDPVMIWPPGLDHGAFVVSPDSVWYAQVLLLFSATSQTDTGSKTFECALVSTARTQRWKHTMTLRMVLIVDIVTIDIIV